MSREEYLSRAAERRKQASKAMSREEYLSRAAERRKQAHKMRQEGLKTKDIAKELNISTGTVKSFFRRKKV